MRRLLAGLGWAIVLGIVVLFLAGGVGAGIGDGFRKGMAKQVDQ